MTQATSATARAESLIDQASRDASVWQDSDEARDLLRCYDDLEAIVLPVAAVEDAMANIEEQLIELRQTAIDTDRRSVDFGDDYDAEDQHDEIVEASAISVTKAMRLTRDAAVAQILRLAECHCNNRIFVPTMRSRAGALA